MIPFLPLVAKPYLYVQKLPEFDFNQMIFVYK